MKLSAANLPVLLGMLLAAALALTPATAFAKGGGKGPDHQRGQYGSHDREGVSSRSGSDDDIERWWQELPESKRDRYRQRYEELQKLPLEQRDRLRDRWQRFRDLPPEQQDKLRRHYQRWQELPPVERERLQETWRHFQQLPAKQQEQLRKELRELRPLPPEERERRRQELHRRYFPELPPPPPRGERQKNGRPK